MHNEDSFREGYLWGYNDALRDVGRVEGGDIERLWQFAVEVLKPWRSEALYGSPGEPPDFTEHPRG